MEGNIETEQHIAPVGELEDHKEKNIEIFTRGGRTMAEFEDSVDRYKRSQYRDSYNKRIEHNGESVAIAHCIFDKLVIGV